MNDENTPNPPQDSAYPPSSNPYPAQEGATGSPPPPPASAPLPMNPYNPGGQPPDNNPYAVGQQPGAYPPPAQSGWQPPPPVDMYQPVAGQAYSPVNGTMILILGILGIVICGICAPIAWVMGNQAMTTLNQYGDPLNQRGTVNAGRICGIVGTVLIGLVIVFYIVMFALGMLGAITHPSSS